MDNSVKPHRAYRHEAFVWRDVDSFLAGTVPFISDGLAFDQPVMVAVIPERTRVLREALGTAADDVMFVDMAELGRNPARIIPAWQRFLDEHATADRAVRGIGEPIWSGRRPEEISESQLHEALLNVAVEPDTPFWLMCPYDAGSLPPEVIDEAFRSHPAVVDAGEYRGSPSYGGSAHVDTVFGAPLSDLGPAYRELVFSRDDHSRMVAVIALETYAAGVPVDRAADLAVAVQELVRSSIRRGAGEGVVRIWKRADAIICEVRDFTVVRDPLLGRRSSPQDQRNGLWVANQLCDLVQLRSTEAGTTARVHHWL